MKLYIIRHGETKWNVERRLQGASDTDLNEKGIALAKVTGEALKEVPFFCCFTSPLKRAKETARLVLGEKEIPVYLDERIQAVSYTHLLVDTYFLSEMGCHRLKALLSSDKC